MFQRNPSSYTDTLVEEGLPRFGDAVVSLGLLSVLLQKVEDATWKVLSSPRGGISDRPSSRLDVTGTWSRFTPRISQTVPPSAARGLPVREAEGAVPVFGDSSSRTWTKRVH